MYRTRQVGTRLALLKNPFSLSYHTLVCPYSSDLLSVDPADPVTSWYLAHTHASYFDGSSVIAQRASSESDPSNELDTANRSISIQSGLGFKCNLVYLGNNATAPSTASGLYLTLTTLELQAFNTNGSTTLKLAPLGAIRDRLASCCSWLSDRDIRSRCRFLCDCVMLFLMLVSVI